MLRYGRAPPYRAPTWTRMAFFGCQACAHRWRSARGEAGVYQKCKHCFEPCYPTEFRLVAPNKDGNMNKETAIGHNMELCGKCAELGYSCQYALDDCDEDEDTTEAIQAGSVEWEEAFEHELTAATTAPAPAVKFKVRPEKRLSQKERRKLAKEQEAALRARLAAQLAAADDDSA
ncbi:hypothetical protein SPRG_21310 [Saprolegnia parasitica CBS 223.65]|uniref:3CxxC-type domain-containing protein n=1 Tax=Saprolegnia parasitica (strain CBS 223.65) TaxID=695850 RepID=A0A067C205_SAPPC|nr:hypothetical protein SPRG_21310 [Saprolegnia parasitica CBS 223.65]KDO20586.1 hypothetical protein SPRG_21310 [Saprolegnia parasitica CBS 223.65]|eukprot:XP_012208715.1 hypothetical protein SPRG_21310 [Saprolegnia parasitica CBS 223.65]